MQYGAGRTHWVPIVEDSLERTNAEFLADAKARRSGISDVSFLFEFPGFYGPWQFIVCDLHTLDSITKRVIQQLDSSTSYVYKRGDFSLQNLAEPHPDQRESAILVIDEALLPIALPSVRSTGKQVYPCDYVLALMRTRTTLEFPRVGSQWVRAVNVHLFRVLTPPLEKSQARSRTAV